MKKIVTVSIFSLSTLLFFNSCTKSSSSSSNNNGGNNSATKLISSIQYSSGSSDFFTYNTNGTISTNITTNGNTVKYVYKSTSIVVDSIVTFSLNSLGLVDTYSSSSITKKYYYDTSGYLKTIATFVNGGPRGAISQTTMITWSNGNESQIFTTDSSTNGGVLYTSSSSISRTYFMDKINSIGDQNMGKPWLGKDSKNLLQKETYNNIDVNGVTTTGTTTYSYDFNNDGTVNKQNISQLGSSTTYWQTYTYK